MTYQLPEPSFEYPSLCKYSGAEMEAAYAAGQRDMREAAAKVCMQIADAGAQTWRKPREDCAAAINALPIGEVK